MNILAGLTATDIGRAGTLHRLEQPEFDVLMIGGEVAPNAEVA